MIQMSTEPGEATQPQRLVFLDRDGTINVDSCYVHRIEDWHFTLCAPAALSLLRNSGFLLAVVTNQSGIAAGVYTELEMHALHDHLRNELGKHGVEIAAIAHCPHAASDYCDCRKPKTGMVRQIVAKLYGPVDYAASWTIGDKVSDIEFGLSIGTRTALLRSRYWTPGKLSVSPDIVADTLFEAAERIAAHGK